MEQRDYETVIGLEVHAQLQTASKLFCEDAVDFGAAPNTLVSAVSLAHPGTLPVINERVIRLAVTLGLALDCDINRRNFFARKNYFYPDLPKGYQVSQDKEPICRGGFVKIETTSGSRAIKLNRIHIEEDAGKSLHDADDTYTCIDLNRAGTALLEIVSEPDLHSAEEAAAYVSELRKIVRWLGVCDGNMEQGSLRCDANVSVRLRGEQVLGTRVEVKNLNSIRHLRKAIELEAARLVAILETGGKIIQETRSYDADTNTTFSLRGKEDAHDYRYFPEPDLAPLHITQDFIEETRKQMPPLPAERHTGLKTKYGLTDYDAAQLVSDKEAADLFERLAFDMPNTKAIANWLNGPVKTYCTANDMPLAAFPIPEEKLHELILYTDSGAVHYNAASTKLLDALILNPAENIQRLALELNLLTNSNKAELEGFIDEAIAAMPDKWKEFKKGKKNLAGLFAGRVKQLSKGTADMAETNNLLFEKAKTS